MGYSWICAINFFPPDLLWSHDPSDTAICVVFRCRRQAVVATRTSDELHGDLALVGKLLNHRCCDPGQERSLEIKKDTSHDVHFCC